MARYFLNEKIPFKVAVEPQEYKDYLINIPKENILKLEFSNLGMGSAPARNACWDHSKKIGAEKHFLFDDNIYGFIKMNNGSTKKSKTPIGLESLYALQAFNERYTNLPICGYNYSYFAGTWTTKPFYLNTHVYSGMLIENDMPYRWRLKYNEDVDLTLQALHNGKCTVLFNLYLIKKISTVTKMKGGNQDELYKNNDPKKKALKTSSLQQVWPHYVKSTIRFGRPHHQISWKRFFKQSLQRHPDFDKIIAEQAKIFKKLLNN